MERPLPDDLISKAAQIRLLALDVDGVMTDGRLFFSAQGDELKAFHSLDGHGIKQLKKAGIDVAIITGRNSPLTARRAADLGITLLQQGREDKAKALIELLAELGLQPEAAAYMGDDLPDLGAIQIAGLGVSVPNGHWYVREHADYCTELAGGEGAVRELCDLILQAQNKLADMHLHYHEPEA
ncbi:HAD hydrolase family protein [Marinobacter sp. BGYM27]|uniref:KdsC family phosphatase n=1 Tax=unclassified Marinobacter TaxID=83889 RepID=UPI0021A74463|nr:HAD hydrolase family protein [Marinobacter sp. BGYM27]MDG5499256.1 HAD hydrolase family protein [Marinobacter sp. BGYM27]